MRGGSAIIAPNGDILAGPAGSEPAFVSAEIDPRRAIDGRLTLDVTGHYARPDIFQLHVNTTTQKNVSSS
jgi:nitrilase